MREIRTPFGIKWKCQRCGRCCGDTKNHVRRIRLTDGEARRISSLTGLEMQLFLRRTRTKPYEYEIKKVHSRCTFYNGMCTIYRVRPLVCRFYPFVLEQSGEVIKIRVGDRMCPGVGKGLRRSRKFYLRLFDSAESVLKL